MVDYYVNMNRQSNGDHEVHKDGFSYLLDSENRIHLGGFWSCAPAVVEAGKHYQQVNGCYWCSRECHTS